MNILAIGAHPDDVEFLCSGTLLRFQEQGHSTTICVVTNGDQGHYQIEPEELAQVRHDEALKAAHVLGSELIWLGIRDEFLFDDEPTRMVFIEAIRRARADVVICHSAEDYHQDHRTVAKIVFSSSFMATIPHVVTDSPNLTALPSLFYMDHSAGSGFEPTEYVDVTGVWDRKVQALECHVSQVTWLREHDQIDVVDYMSVQSRFRGLSCGVKYAEGFRREHSWGRMSTSRLLP